MTIGDQIRDKKVHYDISREAAEISSALSSGKIDKYEYLTGEEILPYQKQIIEQAKFTYSSLGKAFEKKKKTIEDQGKNQINVVKEKGKQINEFNDFNID